MNDLLRKPSTILVADDDADDRQMIQEAFTACHLGASVRFVENGVELMNYLKRRAPFEDPRDYPRPRVILLDLNMPKKDGWEALAEIKADQSLRLIPVIVLTTSQAQKDILRCYDLAAASFITKPVSFEHLTETIQALGKYWLETVQLPLDEHPIDHG